MPKRSTFEPTLYDILNVLDNLTSNLASNFAAFERRIGALEIAIVDMRETMEAIGRAFDIDAVTLIDHEKRITALETPKLSSAR